MPVQQWPNSEGLPLGERANLAQRVIDEVRRAGYAIRVVGSDLEVSRRLPTPLYRQVINSRVAIKAVLRDEATRAERAARPSWARKAYEPRCRILVAQRASNATRAA